MNSRQILLVLLTVVLLVACGDRSTPMFSTTPAVLPNPDPRVPLVAFVEFSTSEPATARLFVSDGKNQREIPFLEALNQTHRLPIVGMKAETEYQLEVEIRDEAGNSARSLPLQYRTPPLPEKFPPIELGVSDPERMEPGFTILGAFKQTEEESEEYEVLAALDSNGDVVWFHESDKEIGVPVPTESGRFLALAGHDRLIEWSLTGQVYREWHAARYPNDGEPRQIPPYSIPVDTETFHHDFAVLPDGNFLTLSTELIEVDDFPSDPAKPGSEKVKATLVSDVVVEIEPDGSIAQQWSLRALLDPNRCGYSSGGNVWAQWGYGHIEGGTKDWLHANSVFYAPEKGWIIVSLRHQDAVIGLSRQTGELVWILGTHEGWGEKWQQYLLRPVGDLEWPYHQHAARMNSSGRLILFDNGNFRSWPPSPQMAPEEHYSRVVEYVIDAEAMTVTQDWVYGGPGSELFFSSFVSEADWLPQTGNILVTDGGRTRNEKGEFTTGFENTKKISAHIFEITRTAQPEKVFELKVEDKAEENPQSWIVYRAERVVRLQP